MSFKVHLYTLSKRDNSTKRPNANTPTVEYDCILKDGCSLFTPAIQLNIGLSADPSQYNYAYIPAFGRYYFIEDWYFADRLWTAHMSVDVLATYKSQIGNSNLYIIRAADVDVSQRNGNITDLLYPAKTGCTFRNTSKANPWTSNVCFVVGVVSANASMGSIKYYVLGSGQMAVMCNALMDPTTVIDPDKGFDLNDASAALQLSLVDPIQYVKTCVMLPVAYTEMVDLGSSEQVIVYNYEPGAIQGIVIQPNSRVNKYYSFNIPQHPDTDTRGNYVNSKPFTNLTLTIPPWGCIDIDTSVTCGESSLDVTVDLDPITGKAVLVVECGGIILNRIESQVGVPISLSSVKADYLGAASSALGAVAGFATGGFLGAANGLGNAIDALIPRAQTIGSTGAFVSNRGSFKLDAQFFRPIDDDPVHNGRPLCEVRKINTLSGYMLIQDGDVQISGTATEDSKIRNYLETGFYYE